MKILRFLGLGGLALFLALGLGWLYLTGTEDVPERSTYAFDLEEIRVQARSVPGALPTAVNHQVVAKAYMPRGAIFARKPFTPHEMVHGVYQIVYPDGFVLIDAGMSQETFDEEMNRDGRGVYDAAGAKRVEEAIEAADAVYVTHEHADHIDGVLSHPNPEKIAARVHLTSKQLENPSTRENLSSQLAAGLVPLDYEKSLAVAPGVVLVAAAGHTPGSQMVYVTLQDASEWLLIGDVAWHIDAILNLHYRPRIVTDVFLDEDRDAVLNQFRVLYELNDQKEVMLVVSHDVQQRDDLIRSGRMGSELELP